MNAIVIIWHHTWKHTRSSCLKGGVPACIVCMRNSTENYSTSIMILYHTFKYQYNCPVIHLWEAEKQSSWPTQGCLPQLDFPPPPPPSSRWGDFGCSQTSATTSGWLPADIHQVGSGWLSQCYPEFQVIARTCLQYASTLLQLPWLLTR